MEKFAVDLEKVLDEFEYNEEREENISAPSIKSPSLPHLGALKQIPAASYRRPSFEPINLADADFAASPPKPSSLNFSLGGPITGNQNEDDDKYGFIGSKPQFNNRNYVNADDNLSSTLNNEANFKNQLMLTSQDSNSKIWPKPHTSFANDEKPDLLEYNSKHVDLDSSNLEIHNQLPDITTSVRTLSHEEENVKNSLDLISTTSVQTSISCESGEKDNLSGSDESLSKNHELSKGFGHLESNYNHHTTEQNESNRVRNSNESHEVGHILNETSNIQVLNNVSGTQGLPKNVFTHNILEVQNESRSYNKETNMKDELQTGQESNGQFENSETAKPIGFSNDSDVSEGEMEEYLKELEEMDKSVLLNQGEPAREELVDKQDVIQKDYEVNSNTFTEKNVISENVIFSNSSLDNINEHDHSEKEKEELLYREDNTNNVLSEDDTMVENRTDLVHTKNVSVASESLVNPSEVFDSSTSSTSQTSENEFVNENKDEKLQVKSIPEGIKYKEESNSLCKNLKNCEEINTNPFSNPNSFEDAAVDSREGKKPSKSTNPFDDEDSGCVGEQVESKIKSTNPFEDDIDEHFSVKNSITETSASSKSMPLLHNINSISNVNEDTNKTRMLDNVVSISDNASALKSHVSNSDEQISSYKEAEDTTAIDSVSTLDESTFSTASTVVMDDLNNDCLPSCSNAQQEPFTKTLESRAKMIPIRTAVESPESDSTVDEAGVLAEEEKPLRPNSLELSKKITVEASVPQSPPPQSPPSSPNAVPGELVRELGPEDRRLGRIPPFWVPDTDATSCMQCQQKFTVLKRRHHCRACGQVLCYKCCGLRARLEYMNFEEARVCQPCFTILEALNMSDAASPLRRQPNPNNPMEYCSTIPPLQQAAGSMHQPPPSVMVPVGVLKREGRMKSEVTKQVMFSDGIRPGGDLTELDGSGEPRMPFRRPGRLTKRVGTPPGGVMSPSMRRVLDPTTHSFIPAEGDMALPPLASRVQGEITFSDLESPITPNQPNIKFALNRNLFVTVKRVMLDCCVNRECWCFSSEGLACVGQDEVVVLLECLPQESLPPKDIFLLINYLYQEAAKGSTVSEMSFTPAWSNNLLGSKDHGGFLYIRTSYQCTTHLNLPSPPYLVALLIHRWETPWARLFPIRLVLRLGAEFRYYPCPLVSVRNRPPLYTDIGHTIINILADFRKYSYTLPSVRGLVIHMEDRQTTINIPRNRYDQVVRALNNSNDSVLAFGANMSLAADSHLVCMQSSEDENSAYTTQAINIHNKPRKVTGASFVVFNGALKVPGLAGKSSIVEDGLMVQVPSETMAALRSALRDMRDYTVGCGPNAEETVVLQWTADDTNFNIGVKSCIDGRPLDGVPSIRVHNGTDYSGGTRIIRWTEVFILQCEDTEHSSEPLDISRLSESIARATCLALVPLLDLLSAASFTTLAVRTTIHPDNVGYEAGSNGEKLPPLYMKSLDNELIAVVHQAALASQDNPCVLELVFRIMEQG